METRPKRLYRSRSDRMIAGICGGIGAYLNLDSTVVRLLFLLLGFISGGVPALIIYLIMMFVVPEDPLSSAPSTTSAAAPSEPPASEPPSPEI